MTKWCLVDGINIINLSGMNALDVDYPMIISGLKKIILSLEKCLLVDYVKQNFWSQNIGICSNFKKKNEKGGAE